MLLSDVRTIHCVKMCVAECDNELATKKKIDKLIETGSVHVILLLDSPYIYLLSKSVWIIKMI